MPLLAPTSDAGRLTVAFRSAQARRAAAIAALVAVYYRTRVDVNDPASIERWLEIMVPRILRQHDIAAAEAATFANALRRLEMPNAAPFTYEAKPGAVAEQIRTSLSVVGPTAYRNKAAEIRRLDEKQFSPTEKTAMLRDLDKATEVKILGAVARHTQNGARETIRDGIAKDKVALGYVRVTRDRPCYFCAMLASRGLTYARDSFDQSDPRFIGEGTAKVHDHCQCHLKPVYDRDADEYIKRSAFFEELWYQFSTGSTAEAIRTFRSGYTQWLASTTTSSG